MTEKEIKESLAVKRKLLQTLEARPTRRDDDEIRLKRNIEKFERKLERIHEQNAIHI